MKCLELSAWHITGNQEMFTIIIIVSILEAKLSQGSG